MHFSILEKLGFAALVAAWVVWGSVQVGNALVSQDQLADNAYPIDIGEGAAAVAATQEVEIEEDVMTLLASASVDDGAKAFRKCAACHGVEEGGPNKVGPNLWGVVGANKGAHEGYSYSEALLNVGGTWSYENLDAFLENPRAYAPGNKMTFNGLRRASERADVILYLRDHHSNPPPLP